jgi:hypothetical protein
VAGVAALLAGLATSPASGAAALTGQLTGFVPPTNGALVVLAVNANNGKVAGVVRSGGAGYRLSVPAGPYLVGVMDEDFNAGTKVGLSDVTAIGRSGGAVNVGPGGPPALAAASGPVIVIRPMPVTADPASGLRSGSMQAQVIAGLFNPCHDGANYTILDGEPALKKAIQQEKQLSDQGRLATQFNYNPPTAGYAISGSGSVDANGNAIVDLKLTDLNSGKTLDHVKSRGDADDIDSLIRRFAAGFAKRDCHKGKKPGPHRPKHKRHKHKAHHHSGAGPFTATYEGHYTDTFLSGDGQLKTVTDLRFNEEVKVELKHGHVSSTSRTLTANGTLDATATPSAGGSYHCTLKASGPTTLNLSIEPNPSRAGGPVDRIVAGMALPDYISPGVLSIAGDPGCNTISGSLDPEDGEDNNADWGAAAAPGPTIHVKDLTFSDHFPVKDDDKYAGGTETVRLTSTLTVSG